MSVTISDVANAAGVSKSTVSKVLNNSSTISPATIERVKSVMTELNYTPNQRAVSFAKQTTDNIVYLANLSAHSAFINPHMFDIMCGVHHELSSSGYTMTLVDTSCETYPGERAIQEIIRRSADGLVIHGSAITQELGEHILEAGIPHIIIGHPEYDNRLCWIDTNHSMAGEFAADHMVDCGYTNVYFLAGKKTEEISNQRVKGFLKGMLNHKIHIAKDRVLYTDASRLGAYKTVLNMLREVHHGDSGTSGGGPKIECIICENSELALGAMKAIQEMKLSLPDDIALLTFDSYPYSGIIDPTPTVIDINLYDMGSQAGSMILRKLTHPELLIQSYTALPVLIQGCTTCCKRKK